MLLLLALFPKSSELALLALFPKSSELALKQLKNATKTSYFKYSLHKSTGVYIRGRQTLGCNLVPVREEIVTGLCGTKVKLFQK